MKRSILVALGTSVFYWLIFTGFDYLAELGRWDNVRHFSVYNFWRNLALVLAPWLLCGVASRWLVAEKYASIPAALIYLLAAALAFYASLRFSLPMYHNGARVYGTMSNVYAPLESCYLFVLLFGLTLARSITRHSREKE